MGGLNEDKRGESLYYIYIYIYQYERNKIKVIKYLLSYRNPWTNVKYICQSIKHFVKHIYLTFVHGSQVYIKK